MRIRRLAYLAMILGAISCTAPPPKPVEGLLAFTGFQLIDGLGAAPVADAVLVVRDGRIESVGPAAEVQIPPGATVTDLSGKFVTPGLILTHGHVGMAKGLESGPQYNTRENITDQLKLYARYGVTSAVSLGSDGPASFEVRDDQSQPGFDYARLFVAGTVVETQNLDEALATVSQNLENGVDFIKLRIDDQLGTVEKMPRTVYGPVITEAHRAGLKVAAHIFYLDDAKQVLDAGADFLAHSIRDQPVDQEVIDLFHETGVCLTPTLTRELSTFVYSETPDFFSDPFFTKAADPDVLKALQDPGYQRSIAESSAAKAYRKALPIAMENLAKLSEAGVPITLGTDSGPPGRFQGFFEHKEMEMMAEAGLTPAQILRSATRDASACLGLSDIGTLEPGKWADFLILEKNPLEDVHNFRSLDAIWIGGTRVDP